MPSLSALFMVLSGHYHDNHQLSHADSTTVKLEWCGSHSGNHDSHFLLAYLACRYPVLTDKLDWTGQKSTRSSRQHKIGQGSRKKGPAKERNLLLEEGQRCWESRLWSQQPSSTLTSCMARITFFSLAEAQFPHLSNRSNQNTSFIDCCEPELS